MEMNCLLHLETHTRNMLSNLTLETLWNRERSLLMMIRHSHVYIAWLSLGDRIRDVDTGTVVHGCGDSVSDNKNGKDAEHSLLTLSSHAAKDSDLIRAKDLK